HICPNGKVLRTSGTIHGGRTLLYRASKLDCDVCLLKAKCCPKEPARKIPRDLHEDARDVARRKMDTKAFLKSRDQRKCQRRRDNASAGGSKNPSQQRARRPPISGVLLAFAFQSGDAASGVASVRGRRERRL